MDPKQKEADNVEEYVQKYAWTIRPCHSYNTEYTECAGIKGRLHQLYIFGEVKDCRDWKSNYRDCNNFEDNEDLQAAKRIIDFERKRREERLKAHFANDVWEHRSEPPSSEEWNKPLPEWMQNAQKDSYLATKRDQLKMNPAQFEIDKNKWCRFM